MAIALVAAGSIAFVMSGGSDASPPIHRNGSGLPPQQRASPPQSRAIAAAVTSRQHAAAWVATQVSRGLVVGCDALMCAALQQHGFPAADLALVGPSTRDPLGSGIVISTAAVRDQLGPELGNVYAPAVIASFGTGTSLVQVRVVTPGGEAAYGAAERADIQARRIAGRELAGNRNIEEPAAARAALMTGRVDSRLLITLAALAAGSRIRVLDFSNAGPGGGASAPLRQVTVAPSSKDDLYRLLAFLDGQRTPFRPIVARLHAGRATTLQIWFTAPNLTGLLSASTGQPMTAASSRRGVG